ncbi:aminotransferase-like domain-containing protein [Tabrizicola oligotrophica]|uniref:PLP-dependent aminotransferase family protein n=1 Tax=Tabrizicola oligotrophica TaxID=2710650 RepID=A0A6M0QPK6_9RHOB|nr:PLP-dependent aminotransferase family protein [Tabrizicola oligotrophica]NEY89061.1 PLP-dependent aminotransferase family protein [Tabrizicola oligotrophica]
MDTIWSGLSAEGDGPKYLNLSRALRDGVRDGQFAEGIQVPTVREMAWALKVTPGTVARAYQILTQEGILAATVGRGTFVAARTPRLGPTEPLFVERDAGTTQGRVDLRVPQLPDVGQAEAISAALHRMADAPLPDWLGYTTQKAEGALREAVCDWLAPRILGSFGPDDIMLSHGGQNAIGLIFDCCLRGERPVVLIEDLSFPGFRYAARLARAEVVGVEMDDEGLLPDALEAACRRHGPQVLCLTPDTQNPTTARMSAARRAEIIAIARRYDLQIIEDECFAPSQSDQPTLRALAPERVWYIGSLSKSVSASLRFGYAICPTGMGEAGRLTAQHGFFALSQPVHRLVLDLMQTGAAAEIRDKVQREMAERLQLMVNRLGAFDLAWQSGLPFAWLRLPLGWRASSFSRMAEDEGVLLRTADQFALIHGRAPHAVRLAVPGNIPRQTMEAGVAALARLLPRPPGDLTV